MLRLTCISQTPAEIVLQIDGALTADQVTLLANEVWRCRQRAPGLVLALDGMAHIDPEGISLLKLCCAQGVRLQGGSPFIQALLQSEGVWPPSVP